MNSSLQVALASGLFGSLGLISAAVINHRAAKRSAHAALRNAQTADWSSYAGRIQERLATVEQRLDVAERRTRECDARADRAEHLQVVAVLYLRKILDWVQQCWPGQTPPEPPQDLEGLL